MRGSVTKAVYLQIDHGNLTDSYGPVILSNGYGQWFNVKSNYNPSTRRAKVWINNCLVVNKTHNTGGVWYFKNGTYGCNASLCRAHFRNIRFWQR